MTIVTNDELMMMMKSGNLFLFIIKFGKLPGASITEEHCIIECDLNTYSYSSFKLCIKLNPCIAKRLQECPCSVLWLRQSPLNRAKRVLKFCILGTHLALKCVTFASFQQKNSWQLITLG